MKSKEFIELAGHFALRVFDTKTGKLLEEFEDKNLIVTVGKTSMSQLLGGSGTNKQVTKIQFGTNGTAPLAADTAITGGVTKTFASVTYPDASSVQFNWTLEDTEGNGLAIREFGLLSQDNTLFARRTRDVINKTSDLRLEGTWKITF